jgi:cation diffusion facilitator family transporter
MIMLAAILIVIKSVAALWRHAPVANVDTGLAFMVAAMVLNGVTGFYLIHVGRKTGALALEADGKHLFADAITSIAVIVALLLVHFTHIAAIDGIAAIIVAIYICFMGVGLLRKSTSGLMDRQDTGDVQVIDHILEDHLAPAGRPPLICNFHKVRHRHSGRYHWVDFHLVVPASWNVAQGHEAASIIEKEIEDALGEGDATAHVEPCVKADCPRCGP